MPKIKGPKKRKGRQLGAPEDTNRFRAAYKKSVKIMQEAIGMATDEAKFPGIQTGNGPISANKPDPVARAAAKAGTSTGVDISGVLQDIAWAPQDGPQTALLTCPVEDIFFGGARGGARGLHSRPEWLAQKEWSSSEISRSGTQSPTQQLVAPLRFSRFSRLANVISLGLRLTTGPLCDVRWTTFGRLSVPTIYGQEPKSPASVILRAMYLAQIWAAGPDGIA